MRCRRSSWCPVLFGAWALFLSGCPSPAPQVRMRGGAVSVAAPDAVVVGDDMGLFLLDLRTRERVPLLPPNFHLRDISPDAGVLLVEDNVGDHWLTDNLGSRLRRVTDRGQRVHWGAFSSDGEAIVVGDLREHRRAYALETLSELPGEVEPAPRSGRVLGRRLPVAERFSRTCSNPEQPVRMLNRLDSIAIELPDRTRRVLVERVGLGPPLARCFFGRPAAFTSDCRAVVFEWDGAVFLGEVASGRVERLTSGDLHAILPASADPGWAHDGGAQPARLGDALP